MKKRPRKSGSIPEGCRLRLWWIMPLRIISIIKWLNLNSLTSIAWCTKTRTSSIKQNMEMSKWRSWRRKCPNLPSKRRLKSCNYLRNWVMRPVSTLLILTLKSRGKSMKNSRNVGKVRTERKKNYRLKIGSLISWRGEWWTTCSIPKNSKTSIVKTRNRFSLGYLWNLVKTRMLRKLSHLLLQNPSPL